MSNNIELYAWPKEYLENGEIEKEFKPFSLEYDVKAAIGAGASGPLPELNLLLVIGASIIASGFLNAVGEDAWKALKKGIAKLANKKPNHKEFSGPKYYKGNIYYELVFWIYFEDTRVLVSLRLSSEDEVLHAMNLLPDAIDSAFHSGEEFSRLVWGETSWEKY